MLLVRNLGLVIEGRTVLEDLNFEIPTGSSVALVGSSGSGKTSLLNILSLIVPPTSGFLTIDDEDLTRVPERKRQVFWRDKASFILQDYGLIDEESAAYNVMLSTPPWVKRAAEKDARVLASLRRVGLEERSSTRVSALSGGEKQRVSIARALYKDAEYVFADEPTASLDSENSDKVAELLLGERSRMRTTVIATHDLSLAQRCEMMIELS